jgi:hypothetical protein
VPLSFAVANVPALIAPTAWQRCADDPATLLLLIACWMGAGALLVVEHRAEIARVKPGFQGSEIEPVQPNGVGTQRATILVYFEK